jgi:hypothetical protein
MWSYFSPVELDLRVILVRESFGIVPKTNSSRVCMCSGICKMKIETTLFRLQQLLHRHLHFAVGRRRTRILGESSPFSLLSSSHTSNRLELRSSSPLLSTCFLPCDPPSPSCHGGGRRSGGEFPRRLRERRRSGRELRTSSRTCACSPCSLPKARPRQGSSRSAMPPLI